MRLFSKKPFFSLPFFYKNKNYFSKYCYLHGSAVCTDVRWAFINHKCQRIGLPGRAANFYINNNIYVHVFGTQGECFQKQTQKGVDSGSYSQMSVLQRCSSCPYKTSTGPRLSEIAATTAALLYDMASIGQLLKKAAWFTFLLRVATTENVTNPRDCRTTNAGTDRVIATSQRTTSSSLLFPA